MKIKPLKFNISHVETRVNWINDSRVNESMFFDLPATVEQTTKWCEAIEKNSSRIDFSFLNEEGDIIAMGGFTGIHKEHNNGEFYVMVNPEMHGQGIGKKVSIWMYNYAFSKLNLHKIYLYTNDDNISAYSIYEKAGFKLEGVLREHKWKKDKYQNRRVYGLLKEEWDKIEWKQIINDEI